MESYSMGVERWGSKPRGEIKDTDDPDYMDLRAIVYELLERWGSKPSGEIKDTDRILDDIRMDGDDYGMSFMPELQRRLGFKASRRDWECVVTVADVMNLVERNVDPRPRTEQQT
jgi:hypothetical protein